MSATHRQARDKFDAPEISINGALVILALIKETADAFPPLSAAASIALAVANSVKVSRSGFNSSKDPHSAPGFPKQQGRMGRFRGFGSSENRLPCRSIERKPSKIITCVG